MESSFKNEKVTTFIKSFLDKFEETCELFFYIHDEIIKNIGLNSMHKVSYVLKF